MRKLNFGAFEKPSSNVAKMMKNYLDSGAVVGRQRSDQLLLPMALAGGGRILTLAPSNHLRTNSEVIEAFLPVKIDSEEQDGGLWAIVVR